MKKEEPQKNAQKLGKIGSAIIKGAEMIGKSMEKGAEKTSEVIKYASEKQKNKIQPTEGDTELSPLLKSSVKGQ